MLRLIIFPTSTELSTSLLIGPTTFFEGLSPGGGGVTLTISAGCYATSPTYNYIPEITCTNTLSTTQKPTPTSSSIAQATPTGGFWILALKEAGGNFGSFEDVEVVPDADTVSCDNIVAKRGKFIVIASQLTQSVQVGPEQIATNSQGFKTVEHGTPQCGLNNLTLTFNGNVDGSKNIFSKQCSHSAHPVLS